MKETLNFNMKGLWNVLAKTESPCSLFRLRDLLNRKNVPMSVKKDFFACEDFLDVVYLAHLQESFCVFAGIESIEDVPVNCEYFS